MQVNGLTRDQLLSQILYLRVHDHLEQVSLRQEAANGPTPAHHSYICLSSAFCCVDSLITQLLMLLHLRC